MLYVQHGEVWYRHIVHNMYNMVQSGTGVYFMICNMVKFGTVFYNICNMVKSGAEVYFIIYATW